MRVTGSIRRKLILAFIVALIPLVLLQVVTFIGWRRVRTDQIITGRTDSAAVAGAMLEGYVTDVLNENAAIEAGLQLDSSLMSSRRLPQLLDSVRSHYLTLSSYAIVNPEGRFIASSPKGASTASVADRDYFRRIMSGEPWVVSDLLISRLTGKPAFVIASQLRDARGVLRGAVVAVVDTHQLRKIFPTRFTSGEIALVDRSGRVVVDSRLDNLSWQERNWSNLDLVRRALAGDSAWSKSYVSPISGERLIGSFVSAPMIGWAAGSFENYGKAMEPINAWSTVIFMGAASAEIVSLLLVWFLGTYLTRPIRRLTSAVKTYSSDGLLLAVRVSSGDEMEDLAAAFNSLGQRITERETQLLDFATRNERLADAAQARAAELEVVIERIPTGVVIVDHQGRVVQKNIRADLLYGMPIAVGETLKEHVKGVRLLNTNGEPYSQESMPISRAIMTGTPVMDEEMIIEHADGGRTVLLVSASPIRDDEGEIIGAVGVLQDISERKRIEERERTIAEALQDSLTPKIPSETCGLRIAAKYIPALEEARVGGDFVDVFEIAEDKVAIVIGDVSGKGLIAARMVAMTKYYVRGYIYEHPESPEWVMDRLSDALLIDQEADRFITAFTGIIDTKRMTLDYASGGHEPPILWRESGEMEDLMPTGMAIGVLDSTYLRRSVELHPGDMLVLYTDGATEARTAGGRMLGYDGLKLMLAGMRGATVQEIADALQAGVHDFAGGRFTDDFTLLVIRPK